MDLSVLEALYALDYTHIHDVVHLESSELDYFLGEEIVCREHPAPDQFFHTTV